MPLNLPNSPKGLVNRAKTDVQRELSETNPFLRNSFVGALTTSFALRVFDFYSQLKLAVKVLFIQTATLDFLKMFGEWFKLPQNASTKSIGNVVFEGTATTVVSTGTSIQSSDGLIYLTTADGTITSTALSVTSLTRAGSIVTATTSADHKIATNMSPVIAGAAETDYNGTHVITVTGSNTFTYTISATPTTPATGTITATHASTYIPVQSEAFGSLQNQDSGVILTLSTPTTGINDDVTVSFDFISGGTDLEDTEDYRSRLLERTRNPIALFNVAAITTEAKKIAGVTRAFIQEITPDVGQVTIYFVRDNDTSIIPSASDVTTVKTQILTIKPSHTDDADVIVAAPTAVPVAFTFTALSPNTSAMQQAIETSIAALFRTKPVGEDVTEDEYRAAIKNTVDRTTGDTVSTFTLSVPAADVTIASSEIATVGTITHA